MKKRIITPLILLFLALTPALAQMSRGTRVINPQFTNFNVGLVDNEIRDRGVDLNINLGIGQMLFRNFLLKADIGYGFDDTEGVARSEFSILATARYYLFGSLFGGVSFGYENQRIGGSRVSSNYLPFDLELGYAIFLNSRIALEPSIYWRNSLLDHYSLVGFRMGIGYYF